MEAALSLTDEQLAAPYHLRPVYDRAFLDRIGPPGERFARRGVQAADWNRVICTGDLRKALHRYAQTPLVRHVLNLEDMEAALDHWPTGFLNGDKESAAFGGELLVAFSLASFLHVHGNA